MRLVGRGRTLCRQSSTVRRLHSPRGSSSRRLSALPPSGPGGGLSAKNVVAAESRAAALARGAPFDAFSSFSSSPAAVQQERREQTGARGICKETEISVAAFLPAPGNARAACAAEAALWLDRTRDCPDSGNLYALEESLRRANTFTEQNSRRLEEIRLLGERILSLKRETAKLLSFRHQSPAEVRRESVLLLASAFSVALAAAIHPILVLGGVYGIYAMRKVTKAERERDAGTARLEEVNSLLREDTKQVALLVEEIRATLRDGQGVAAAVDDRS